MLYSTQLGIATVASGLGPDDSLVVFRELQAAQRGFVLENELHIIYQVGPRGEGVSIGGHTFVCVCIHAASSCTVYSHVILMHDANIHSTYVCTYTYISTCA